MPESAATYKEAKSRQPDQTFNETGSLKLAVHVTETDPDQQPNTNVRDKSDHPSNAAARPESQHNIRRPLIPRLLLPSNAKKYFRAIRQLFVCWRQCDTIRFEQSPE